MRNFRRFVLVALCFVGTGAGVAWADPQRRGAADYIEDPYAPHATSGTEARVGTTVGFLYTDRLTKVTALGVTAALGQRVGRFALESEVSYLQLQEYGASNLRLGTGTRLGVVGRYDVLRLGPHVVGPNSLGAVYVEGGVGLAWNAWWKPTYDQPDRLVPDDTRRVEGQAGFGVSIDHRLQEPITFPRRVGWFLGIREAIAPHDAAPASVCRGATCSAAPAMPAASYTDRSMLFQSSLLFTW